MRMPDGAYRPHENLVSTAREKPQIWRLVLGLVVAGFVTFFAGFAMRTVLGVVSPDLQRELLNPANGEGNTPLTLLLLLFSFGFVILGIFVAARLVQQRSPLSLIGPLSLAIRQFLRVAGLVIALGVLVMILPPYDMGEPLEPNLPIGIWLALLPISLLAVLTQVASEEILFRLYAAGAGRALPVTSRGDGGTGDPLWHRTLCPRAGGGECSPYRGLGLWFWCNGG